MLSLFITYNSDSGLLSQDLESAAAAVAWRLLYRYFIFKNSDTITSLAQFFALLPSFWKELTIQTALDSIRETLEREKKWAIFLGIDEFQILAEKSETSLRDLFSQLGPIYFNQQVKDFFFALAGTYWLPLSELRATSRVDLIQIPLPVLPPQELLRKLNALHYQDQILDLTHWFSNERFRQHVRSFGGIPGHLTFYLEEVLQGSDPKAQPNEGILEAGFQKTRRKFAGLGLPAPLLLRIVAQSVSSIPVLEQQVIHPQVQAGLRWIDAEAKGVILLDERKQVTLPQFFLWDIARSDFPNLDSPIRDLHFALQNLYLVETVYFNLEPWQAWERFGAYTEAVRSAAFQVLQIQPILRQYFQVEIPAQFQNIRIDLKNKQVISAGQSLSSNLTLVCSSTDSKQAYDPLSSSLIFLNATNGEGIDIWTTYDTSDGRKILLLD